MSIFIDTDCDTCLLRRIKRDILERGYELNDVLDYYTKHVKSGYERFILPHRTRVDIIVNGNNYFDAAIMAIATYLLHAP